MLARHEELGRLLHEAHAEAAEVARRCTELRREVRGLRESLWGGVIRGRRPHCRRPGFPGPAPIPRAIDEAEPLCGADLRNAALAILVRRSQTGDPEIALPEIHRTLIACGFRIDDANPVKALANALGYEATQGRAVRTRRGHYSIGELSPDRRRRLLHAWAAKVGRAALASSSLTRDPERPRPVPWASVYTTLGIHQLVRTPGAPPENLSPEGGGP